MASLTRLQRAYYYSPLSFVRGREKALASSVLDALEKWRSEEGSRVVGDTDHLWIRNLEWDTEYFGTATYRIEFSDWGENTRSPVAALTHALRHAKSDLASRHGGCYYLFGEVPSEDVLVLQAMGSCGFRLIETRLTYYRDDIDRFECGRRSAVRLATEEDIPSIKRVAMESRNEYDRFHADVFFSASKADEYLGRYAENSVKGFADLVVVPAGVEGEPEAFLTGVFLPEQAVIGGKVGRMVLSAVGAARRGWYRRLIAEMSHMYREMDVKIVFMSTQSTNRAVIRVWESLGYRFGRATHILAAYGDGCSGELR